MNDESDGLARTAVERTPRRSFLASITAAILAVATSPGHVMAHSLRKRPTYGTGEHRSAAPFPSYLPPGYRYLTTYFGRPDGFKGGSGEIALWFKNPRLVNGFNHPLAIFIATEVKHEFSLTEQRVPEPLRFWISESQAIDAAYHDGMWVMAADGEHVHASGVRQHWETKHAHSLTFKLQNFMIGIRGSRSAGVTLDEMVKVARSLR